MQRTFQFRRTNTVKLLMAAPLLAAAALAFTAGDSLAADKKRGVLIIDGSSSMAGPLAGGGRVARTSRITTNEDEMIPGMRQTVRRTGKAVSKMSQVKATLSKAYGDFRNRIDLGIVAYGSTSPESCSDIKTIKPVGSISPGAYAAATNGISTVGASPVTAAVKKAAELANYKNSINTLVLITDSVDSCNLNPCKLGGELRNSGANITVHVIGIGLPRSQQTDLRCLAGHTRGHYFDVRSRQELTQAIYGAMNGISITRHLTPEPPPSPEVIAEAEKAGRNIIGAEKLALVPLPRRKPRKPKTAEAPAVAEAANADNADRTNIPAPPIPPGDMKQPATTPPVIDQAKSVIAAAKPATPAPGGNAAATPGQLSAVARIVTGSAPMTSGVNWTVYMAEAGAPSRRVATSKDAQPTFELKPGDYVIESNLGYARVRDFVSVAPGEKASSDVAFNAGGLSLSTVLAGKTPPNPADVSYTVSDRGTGRIVVKNLGSNKVIHLNSGDYEVISRYGSANAIVKANLSIQPGKLTEATLNHNAGRINFKLEGDGGKALENVRWEVETSNGTAVANSVVSRPGYVLAAGAYKVVAKHEGNIYRSSFMVRPGEDKTKVLTTK